MRKSRHLCRRRALAVVAARERYAKHLGGGHGIAEICFIEVAATKQQYRIGVFGLQIAELPHHRREFFFCHSGENVFEIE